MVADKGNLSVKERITDDFQLLFFGNWAVFIYIPSPGCASAVDISEVTVVRGLCLKQKLRLEFLMW